MTENTEENTVDNTEELYTASGLAKALGVVYSAVTRDAIREKLTAAGFDVSGTGGTWRIPINETTIPLLPKSKKINSTISSSEKGRDILALEAEIEKLDSQIKRKNEDLKSIVERKTMEITSLKDQQNSLERELRHLRRTAIKQVESEVEEAERHLAEVRARAAMVKEKVES